MPIGILHWCQRTHTAKQCLCRVKQQVHFNTPLPWTTYPSFGWFSCQKRRKHPVILHIQEHSIHSPSFVVTTQTLGNWPRAVTWGSGKSPQLCVSSTQKCQSYIGLPSLTSGGTYWQGSKGKRSMCCCCGGSIKITLKLIEAQTNNNQKHHLYGKCRLQCRVQWG